MKVIMIKRSTDEHMKEMERDFEEKYGSIDSLAQKTGIEKCSVPSQIDDYEVWKAIRKGAELEEEIVFSEYSIFDALKSSRIEMLEYIRKHRVESIKELAQALKRDYKNIYFDLSALQDYELVEIKVTGRRRVPTSRIEKIEIIFE
jgi:predicted transcriptional regulator